MGAVYTGRTDRWAASCYLGSSSSSCTARCAPGNTATAADAVAAEVLCTSSGCVSVVLLCHSTANAKSGSSRVELLAGRKTWQGPGCFLTLS